MHATRPRSFILGALLALSTVCALAQEPEVKATPLPAGHPLVGRWRLDLPRAGCFEVYDLHANGTLDVTSGQQAAGSEFEISTQPSARGYYKWVDKVTRDNGKPDCSGNLTPAGQVVTNYVLLHPSGRQFMICAAESRETCFGPLRKQRGD